MEKENTIIKKSVFSLFLSLCSKSECKAPYKEKKKSKLLKTCLLSVFIFFRSKSLKRIQKTLYGENNITENMYFKSSGHISYQNAKMHAKHPIWGYETILPFRNF